MKAMMLTGIRQMQPMDVPQPQIENDTDVLIRMSVVGICGSDVHYYTEGADRLTGSPIPIYGRA